MAYKNGSGIYGFLLPGLAHVYVITLKKSEVQ